VYPPSLQDRSSHAYGKAHQPADHPTSGYVPASQSSDRSSQDNTDTSTSVGGSKEIEMFR
jgi:hypothetical protein